MRVIVTGVTGMVGEGVLLECLANPAVSEVLALSRRPSGHSHPKLSELLIADFRELELERSGSASFDERLRGYDGCFYCAGISSVGLDEAAYGVITYDTPLALARALVRVNPSMTFVHVSGSHTDSSEQGKVMWARVKGKAENALTALPFAGVVHFRPSLMKPVDGQRHVKKAFRFFLVFFPLLSLLFPALTLQQVARAMLQCARERPRAVYEVPDIAAAAARFDSAPGA
ncbi:MAG TPA: NAD-dependent epimerase/dehydratase family protein [Polyangiaceae bacterium]|nr:NAD-dependent epimerase/dehydratase family protein [Polyangiaceae bacterium]